MYRTVGAVQPDQHGGPELQDQPGEGAGPHDTSPAGGSAGTAGPARTRAHHQVPQAVRQARYVWDLYWKDFDTSLILFYLQVRPELLSGQR